MSLQAPADQFRLESLTQEPIVRIGVVLHEDGKSQIRLHVTADGHVWNAQGPDDSKPAPVGEFRVRADGDLVRLEDAGGAALLGPVALLTLVPPPGAQPQKAGDGTLVRGVVAGRGFHWQKEIDQTLSDALEFRARGGRLVMVNALPLETYLTGVITGEMSGDCPTEFLKAQATAARSWLLGQIRTPHLEEGIFVWCNDDCCQRYQGTGGWSEGARLAIRDCAGQVLLTRDGRYCDARYSKSTGGISEDAASVWPDDREITGLEARVDAPQGDRCAGFFPITENNVADYLMGDWLKDTGAFASPNVVAEDSITKYLGRVDEPGTYFRWKRTLSHDEVRGALRRRAGLDDCEQIVDLRTGSRGRSGRLETLDVDYRTADGTEKSHTLRREYHIRAGIDPNFLYSSCFVLTMSKDSNGVLMELELTGAGWGHGAGLCQIGGLGRALKGQDFEEILMAYYSGVELKKVY